MPSIEIVTVAEHERLEKIRRLPDFADASRSAIFGPFGRTYFPVALEHRPVDMSFAILVESKPDLLVDCDLYDGTIGRYGFPLQAWLAPGTARSHAAAAIRGAFQHLDEIVGKNNVNEIKVRDSQTGQELSDVGKAAMNRGARLSSCITATVNLELDEDHIRRALRKSFRSLVNWGRNNLRLEYVNAEYPDMALLDRMRQFHSDVAGKETRSDESWTLQFEQVSQGGGEVSLAFDTDDTLLAANMVIDGEDEAVYVSGVYDREHFDKPLAHWPLFNAILRSKARGRQRFVLGDIPMSGAASDKEVSIGYFKRGFATQLETHFVWEWRRSWDA